MTPDEKLRAYLDRRYISASDLLDTYNPERLSVHGHGSRVLGADTASNGPFYVFITRPDLNLTGPGLEISSKVLGIGGPMAPVMLAEQLTNGVGFIPLLTNIIEGYQAQDIALDVLSVGEGWDGSKMTVPKSTLNSRQNQTIQFEMREMVGTPATFLHKIWVDYISAVTRGTIFPKATPINYIAERILDFASTIYCIQLESDGETIQFGMKLTGAFPTAVPFSAFRGVVGNSEAIKLTIPYAYSYFEAMDAAIYDEFNIAAGMSGVSVLGIDSNGIPLANSKRMVYKLAFTGTKSLSVLSRPSV